LEESKTVSSPVVFSFCSLTTPFVPQNRMAESPILFENVINLRWFLRTSVILFLSNIDVSESKLLKGASYLPLAPLILHRLCIFPPLEVRHLRNILSGVHRAAQYQQSCGVHIMALHASKLGVIEPIPTVSPVSSSFRLSANYSVQRLQSHASQFIQPTSNFDSLPLRI